MEKYFYVFLSKEDKFSGVLIELKAGKNGSAEKLKELSEMALQQILERKYDTEMRVKGVQRILKLGVAFSGKNVEISTGKV